MTNTERDMRERLTHKPVHELEQMLRDLGSDTPVGRAALDELRSRYEAMDEQWDDEDAHDEYWSSS